MTDIKIFRKNINPLTSINDSKFNNSRTKEFERSIIALNSYMSYFKNKTNYEINKNSNYLIYKYKNYEVIITADMLTNSKLIDEMNKKFGLQNSNEIKAFEKVKFTIGNCCPVWKNPPSGQGVLNDTIWYKLNKHIFEKRKQQLHPINLIARIQNKDNDINNINNRDSEEIFSIFNSDISWEKLISDLYLQDYFNYDWNLLDEKFIIVKNIEEKDFLEFVKITTVLIVQRSYRIITGYKGNILRKQDKEIIEDILNTIGLENTKCIYSKKKRI